MKNISLFIIAAFYTLTISAQQVDDFVFLEENYVQQSYYSMSNGEVANVDNTNWDLAFDANPFGVSIRINGQMGTKLFSYTDGDTADWSNIDTVGIGTWPQQFDSDILWEDGAFNRSIDGSNEFDYGWGIYNPITHKVTGDSLYVIKLSDGNYKKIWIEDMALGVYHFKYADLDGGNETSVAMTKSDYADKNYGYYSIINEEEIDREPNSDTWDIVFTKYIGLFDPETYWSLTGAMHNNNVTSAMADGVDVGDALWSDYTMSDTISTIGWDWKIFNMTLFIYEMVEDRCYFVKDQSGVVWKLIFTGFIGATTGEVAFTVEEVGFILGLDEIEIQSDFTIYPNPLRQGNLRIEMLNTSSDTYVNIIDLSGKQVFSSKFNKQGNQIEQLDLSHLNSGLYIISMISNQGKVSKKLIVD
jgi:hypothetical protein